MGLNLINKIKVLWITNSKLVLFEKKYFQHHRIRLDLKKIRSGLRPGPSLGSLKDPILVMDRAWKNPA